ncbi:Crp/Fnr family transcriptional regulator [Galbibacter mesophilus]|uniref:Crp/Fnr family transcriptional regulator n=1 Tax=Galbibacter mesophilus TaxID=379069 RepID=UPI00191D9CC1|nr:Crp/Fnr family transcriptional regulator [Galbibacter mesophilus]MCM5661359.1 Crp/Fnr family transcriptional regulator [Galbibacter mesophilus]
MHTCKNCKSYDCSLFKYLNKNEIGELEDSKKTINFKKGDIIFYEGEVVNKVICIKNGVCKLTKINDNGFEQTLRLVSSGGLFGQRAVITNSPSKYNAIAVEDVTVCYIPKNELLSFLERNNIFNIEIFHTICQDLDLTEEYITTMTHKTVRERIIKMLLLLFENYGESESGDLRIKLTREELASLVGTTPESCIRVLSELKKNKLIKFLDKRTISLNVAELEKRTV